MINEAYDEGPKLHLRRLDDKTQLTQRWLDLKAKYTFYLSLVMFRPIECPAAISALIGSVLNI